MWPRHTPQYNLFTTGNSTIGPGILHEALPTDGNHFSSRRDGKLTVLGLLDLVSISHEEQPPRNLFLTPKFTLLFTVVEIYHY